MWSQSKISAEPQCCECYPYGSLIKAWQSLQQYTMHALPFLLISPQPWHLWSSLLFLSTQRNIKNQKYNASAASLNETKSLSSYINNHSHTSHTHAQTQAVPSQTQRTIKSGVLMIFSFSSYCLIPQCHALQQTRTWAFFIKAAHCQGETKNNEKL